MQVMLLKDVKGTGKAGDIVKIGLRRKGVFVFDAETGERLR